MITKPSGRRRSFLELKNNWWTLSIYERFEQVVALVLTTLIAVIIAIATWDLAKSVVALLWKGLLDPFEPQVLQAIFGQIMLLLIALEFKHSILKVVAHRESIAQVKTVLLIALLAVSRKFIVLDTSQTSPQTILALAAVIVALGLSYWLIRGREAAPSSQR
ncbi:MAG TPA: phosphate-starvation-inducible PsiE family protein [Polyangia bacterium]|jgi:uncharacterized membrane protein (DUF373 family)|nr:phosphate-starvation-inducible PsiE family protein [Polyangia bacterium]